MKAGRSLSRTRHLRGHPTKPGPLEARKLGEAPHTVRSSPLQKTQGSRSAASCVPPPPVIGGSCSCPAFVGRGEEGRR